MSMNVEINPADYSVLVCDDEESIRALLAEALGGWGFQVETAPNGEVAYEHLQAGNLPHIILTDIRMGGMTGLDLATKAKELSKEIEVIIMTSHGSLDSAVAAMRIGVYDYLSKPFDDIENVRTVILHVCKRIYMKLYTEYLMGEVNRKNQEVEALANFGRNLAESLNPQTTLEVGCLGVSNAFNGTPVVFFTLSGDASTLSVGARYPKTLFGGTLPTVAVTRAALGNEDALARWLHALDSSEAFKKLLVQASAMSPEIFKGPKAPEWTVKAVVIRGTPRGAIAVARRFDENSDDVGLFSRYLEGLGINLDNAILHAKTLESSIRDGLTGLFNVKHFKDRLTQDLSLSQRHSAPLSIIFFDVDHFKKYNDTHGHPAGDTLLKKMAAILKSFFRNTEIIARYGGEEFVVIMHRCALANALIKAEGLRHLIETTPFEGGQTQPLGKVTVSIGVSEYPTTGDSMESIIKAADDALYEAKHKSRNLVVPAKAPAGYVPPYRPVTAPPAGSAAK